MALEEEARLLKKGVHAGLIDSDKGTAALVVFAQLQRMGAAFSFGDFLVERKILSRMALAALKQAAQENVTDKIRTVSCLGDFELLEMVGEGETGAVFRARQLSLNRIVAVKVLSPAVADDQEGLDRFLREARAVAQLNHPNIVHGIHVGNDEGLHYFVMELVEGSTVRSLLEEHPGGLPEDEALRICRQVSEALSVAHAQGLLHRDIKPENLLLSDEGCVKVTDLGISLRCERSPGGEGESTVRLNPLFDGQAAAGEFWGSPPYVAPEVIEGRGTNDPRSDLYALGATLFEILTGKPPFQGATPEQTLRLHLSAEPPEIAKLQPNVSAPTATFCRRLLAKNPVDRFPDAGAVTAALDEIIAARGGKRRQMRRRARAGATGAAGRVGRTRRPTKGRGTETVEARRNKKKKKATAESHQRSFRTGKTGKADKIGRGRRGPARKGPSGRQTGRRRNRPKP